MNVFFDNGIKVPEDISVVGFDDSIISRKIRPGLTTVRQDIIEKGKKSVENIMQIINGEYNKKNDYINVQLPIKVIKRQTVLNLNE
jgi:LacI family transcriptional regulator